MDRDVIKRFLDEYKINYEEEYGRDRNNGRFILKDYKKVKEINYYYNNCNILVEDENNFVMYDCDRHLSKDFLEDYR